MMSPKIAIVGAGMGGMAAAGTLRQAGIDVEVYEQAQQFGRDRRRHPDVAEFHEGAARYRRRGHVCASARLRLTPISIALATPARSSASCRCRRDLYGAPFLCMHRADLHEALTSIVPREIIHLNKKLVGLEQNGGPVTLSFADGTTATADAVIGADGVHSVVRDIIIGPDKPIHRGRIAYRAVFASNLLAEGNLAIAHQVVGRGPPHRDLLHDQGPQPALLRHQRAGAGRLDDKGVVVGQGRCARVAQGLCRLPSGSADGAGRLSRLPQMGDSGTRSATDLEPGQGGSDRRCLPSDDALYGARRGHLDRGCCGAGALSERRVGRGYRSGIQTL